MNSKSVRTIGCGLVLALMAVAAGWPTPAVAASAPNDPLFKQQWGLRRIGAPTAWTTTQGAGITIAIVDTGVDKTHEDLKGNFLPAKQYDAINDDFDAADLHPRGHGTSVAGVAAAVTNNRKGIAGVAPKAKIMAVRAFGAQRDAEPADVADGVMWAADNGANVINLSLGGSGFSVANRDIGAPSETEVATAYATARGVLVVAAAGNGGADRIGDPICEYPAFSPAVLCVGASDELDRMANFSNYFLGMDVVAPGTSILTTDKLGIYSPHQGTSLAAPFVAGVGALLMSMGASNVQAAQIIRSSAMDLGLPGYDNTYGFGRLDAKVAVDLCKEVC